ncbi:MAG TPA: deoxyribonuclease IV, partial [Thermoplasmata archaeon]|nr:deoxyribonuclease IV [Thermoplasmata archaeon]
MIFGAHIGIAKGLGQAAVSGRRIGCDAIQIFSKSPQMWSGPPTPPEGARAFSEAVAREGIRATAIHHGYLANLGSPKPEGLLRSRQALVDELHRAALLGVDALILHPGAHLGEGLDPGIARIAESLNEAFRSFDGFRGRLLLENAAGQGSTIGSSFSELRGILNGVAERQRVGVALDTCHLFAAGDDFRTPETYGALMDRLASEVGLEEVRAFHLNDAKAPLGSHRDRHENIGKGLIGLDGFRQFAQDRRWEAHPGYLETPMAAKDEEYETYRVDLEALRSLGGR